MSNLPPCNDFDRPDNNNGYNVLYQALHQAADCVDYRDNDSLYNFLENTPRASFTVELVQELHRLGYKIVKDD